MGKEQVQEQFSPRLKTMAEVAGKKAQPFHPELPKVDKSQILDTQITIVEARLITDWDSPFSSQNTSFALLHFTSADGFEGTTLVGGKVVVKQIKEVISKRQLPILATLRILQGAEFPYYCFE